MGAHVQDTASGPHEFPGIVRHAQIHLVIVGSAPVERAASTGQREQISRPSAILAGRTKGDDVPKYLLEVNYTLEGITAVLDKGGSARKAAAQAAAKSVGGKVESFHFAFGSSDAYVIADLPDNTAAAALAMTVSAGGGATVNTVVLLTPDEVDKAAEHKVKYSPPGS